MSLQAPFLPKSTKTFSRCDGDTILHEACYKGHYESALMLILSGQSVMATNSWGHTPLHYCTSQGHLEIMLLLLDSGACVNVRDKENLTPLHQAVIHANKHAAELLICYGASVCNTSTVVDTCSVLELAQHVHVCHQVIVGAVGVVRPLQHLCKVAVRQSLGASRRKRLKELPLPKHLLSYLCSLPVAKSLILHQNWDRVQSNKCEAVRKRGVAKRLDYRTLPSCHGNNQ